ncbi:MAG: hypothetical protein KME27_21580 [Lyngbya sp. HA4199-MV5]|jgi:hypothetical protein|nr:hypothetical protein [Lyngbya sp. HA4199-MV5]
MQLPFSAAHTAPAIAPCDPNDPSIATTHHASATVDDNADLAAIADLHADQPTVPTVDKPAPLEVVKQTIDDLEAQGLLMLFDRHDQVAKRLTGDLMAAGVLPEVDVLPVGLSPEAAQSSQQEAYTNH